MRRFFDKDRSLLVKVYGFLCFVFLLTSPIVTREVVADTGDNLVIVNVLCNAQKELTGGIGKAIAVLIVISLAIALFLGKVTWGVAIAVGVGMGVLFGAPGIVNLLSGGKNAICIDAGAVG